MRRKPAVLLLIGTSTFLWLNRPSQLKFGVGKVAGNSFCLMQIWLLLGSVNVYKRLHCFTRIFDNVFSHFAAKFLLRASAENEHLRKTCKNKLTATCGLSATNF